MEREKKKGGWMRGSSERRHRRERLGIRIEREKISGQKKVWGADFLVGKRCSSLEPSNWRGERIGMFLDFCYITI